jgi:hypothetical protein
MLAAWDNDFDEIDGAILIVSTMTFIGMVVVLMGLQATLTAY